MASRQVLLLAAAAIAVAFLPVRASAEVYMVGDDAGWTLKYPATWTEGKTFRVGDVLMFMYPIGKHTVMEVGGADFKTCNITGNQLNSWTSGKDYVTLDKAGRRWFTCSVDDHCTRNMKLLVNIIDGSAPAPGPAVPASPPSSSASLVGGAVSQTIAAAGAMAAAMFMF